MLPIGSVVLLKDAKKRLMIVGRIQTCEGKEEIFDYSGCVYPEGVTSSKDFFFFNKEDIANVFFIGFQDPEEILFQQEVLDELDELIVKDGQIVPKALYESENRVTE